MTQQGQAELLAARELWAATEAEVVRQRADGRCDEQSHGGDGADITEAARRAKDEASRLRRSAVQEADAIRASAELDAAMVLADARQLSEDLLAPQQELDAALALEAGARQEADLHHPMPGASPAVGDPP